MSSRSEIRKRLRLLASVIGKGDALNLSECSLVDYDGMWTPDENWEEVAFDDFFTIWRAADGSELRAKYRCRLSDEELQRRGGELSYL